MRLPPCRRKDRCCRRPSWSTAACRARRSSIACKPKPRKAAEKAWAQRKRDLPLKSLEEAIVLASIVEKETGRADERERVAAVFVNRLKANMRLQSDPTILYGLSGGKTVWSRPIQKTEIAQKTAHNTYQIDGLPPTPICNPGRASIEAVLNPADTKELFFVADGTGRHVFAETAKEHNANVQKWRAAEKDMKAKARRPAGRRGHADHGQPRRAPREHARTKSAKPRRRPPAPRRPRRPAAGQGAALGAQAQAQTPADAASRLRAVALPCSSWALRLS